MKSLIPSRTRKFGAIQKVLLLFFLVTTFLIVRLDVAWSYHNFESGMGTRMAQAAIAYHIVLLLGMAGVGVRLGLWVDHMIRNRTSIFRSPATGSWTETFMNLWGYELHSEEATIPEIIPESEPNSNLPESYVLLDLPTRRGRKPTFPLDRWLPITVQWENRDPIRDAFTLAELISEHLGTNSDGSPIVSEQAYYSTWRPRAIAELHRRAKLKNHAPSSK